MFVEHNYECPCCRANTVEKRGEVCWECDDSFTCCDICGREALAEDMAMDWDRKLVCPGCRATGYFEFGKPDWSPDND